VGPQADAESIRALEAFSWRKDFWHDEVNEETPAPLTEGVQP
jgi:hypothetical protein